MSRADFTLDTSGVVRLGWYSPSKPWDFVWSDLSPFAQGYTAEGFADLYVIGTTIRAATVGHGFTSLAPETVEAILKDCTAADRKFNVRHDADAGRAFWRYRQSGRSADFPPVTFSFGDDGKVYLREAGI